jgi:hypothetical protein
VVVDEETIVLVVTMDAFEAFIEAETLTPPEFDSETR